MGKIPSSMKFFPQTSPLPPSGDTPRNDFTLYILHFTIPIPLLSILHFLSFYTAKIPTKLWGHSPQNTTREQNEISLRKILKSQNTQLKAENPKSLTLPNSSVPQFHNPPSVYSVYSVVQFPRVTCPHCVTEKFVV